MTPHNTKVIVVALCTFAALLLIPASAFAIGLLGHIGSVHHAAHVGLAFLGLEGGVLACVCVATAVFWLADK